VPVIVVTGYNDPERLLSKSVKALGAVAFVQKPIDTEELSALIDVAMQTHPKRKPTPAEIRKGAMRADTRFRTVWIDDKLRATLPPKRFALLQMLMEAEGPVRRELLLRGVWGEDAAEHVLVKAVQRLREDLGAEARRLQTTESGYELVG
jgi:DNA-binding response OmpR family regulator